VNPNTTWRKRILATEHIIAVLVAIVSGAIVVRYTGDSDLLLAAGSGVGSGALAFLATRLHSRR
jgi:hypothetical protein